jgi:hypothetical protein
MGDGSKLEVYPNAAQDEAMFATAVEVLKSHFDLGRKWPLSYTLPTGRSIESLCDRAAYLPGDVPLDLLPMLNYLARALGIVEPAGRSYRDYALVVQEIAARLALPVDQRQRRR